MTPATDPIPAPDAASRAALLRAGIAMLAPSSASAQREAALLLAHVLNLSRAQLMTDLDVRVPDGVGAAYLALTARRAAGEPAAYLTGMREFWSLQLAVDASVLIPRPETELLVERALALCDAAAPTLRVLDLGTGSGAVALAIASERPNWRVLATDVSAAALAVARANAKRLELTGVEFTTSNWFDALPDERFDLIVSNPPYVAADDAALATDGVRFEPRLALVAGTDGLESLQAIAVRAAAHLTAGGAIALEHGAAQGAAVREMLVAQGFIHVRSHLDYAGRERVTEGLRP